MTLPPDSPDISSRLSTPAAVGAVPDRSTVDDSPGSSTAKGNALGRRATRRPTAPATSKTVPSSRGERGVRRGGRVGSVAASLVR